jgi:DNA-binding protein HU-beta
MNRSQLVDRIADASSRTMKDVDEVLNQMVQSIRSTTEQGERMTLPRFGSFTRTARRAGTDRNPRTGAAIEIAAFKDMEFTAGAGFRSAVN